MDNKERAKKIKECLKNIDWSVNRRRTAHSDIERKAITEHMNFWKNELHTLTDQV